MSAALQLPMVWGSGFADTVCQIENREKKPRQRDREKEGRTAAAIEPVINVGFYRRHTESLLRRYLYASTQVGRAPSLLNSPVSRGWASSRPVRSFEDAVIFVLDVETCLNRLDEVDKQLLSRVVLQEYTQEETAVMLGMCTRTVSSRLGKALDRLTQQLLAAGLLIIPE